MADDLGIRHLGAYGGTKIKTPHIDRIAAQGIRFTNAYAGSTVCAPSRSVLLTGLHGGHTPVRGNLGDAHIADSDVTLAEMLKQAGYATGGYGKWGLGLADSPGAPWKQGFDDFLGYLHQVHAHFFYPYWLTFNDTRLPLPGNRLGGRESFTHDVIFDRALEFIRANQDGPFFVYLPVTIPHVELVVPRPSLDEYLDTFPEDPQFQEPRIGYFISPNPRATYAAMVTHLDNDVGRLAALLDELKIAENTIFIVNSDNGAQSYYDVSEDFFEPTGPLRGYKGSMHEGGLRIPQIVRWPGKVAPGSTTDHVTYFPDMMATFADVAGVTPPRTDGISFVPAITGQGTQRTHDWLYWELISDGNRITRRGARNGKWKYVQDKMDEPVKLYDLSGDISESNDLAGSLPERIEAFETWFRENRTEPPTAPKRTRVTYEDYVSVAPGPPNKGPDGWRRRVKNVTYP